MDAELDLAVAKVMRLRIEVDRGCVWIVPPDDGDTSGYPFCYQGIGTTVNGNRTFAQAFSPSSGGADAWEVHQWVRAQGYYVRLEWLYEGNDAPMRGAACSIYDHKTRLGPMGIGPDDATALCRAVVELGGEG